MLTQRYESLILTVPEITNDEATELEKSIEKKIQESGSKLVTYDRWGKFLLAYPVKKNEYGIYFLARFDVPVAKKAEVVKELKQLFDLKFNILVMRHVICNIPNDAPSTYKRPQSLDEMPKDVDQFLKDNKMSGFNQRRQGYRSDDMPMNNRPDRFDRPDRPERSERSERSEKQEAPVAFDKQEFSGEEQ